MSSTHIIGIIEELFDLDASKLDEGTNINDLENWDSLKHMQLIMKIEEELKITLTADEISEVQTVKDLKQLCSDKID